MALSEGRVLSRPCIIRFAGWETTTNRLQQAGWSLSAEQDLNWGRVQLAMRYEPLGLYMLTDTVDWDFFARRERVPEFNVRTCSSRLHVQADDVVTAFQPIDCMPQYITATYKNIEDFNIFATPLTRTQELIVDPETVSSLLDRIKKLQEPELAAIRESNRRQEKANPRQMFHAQIISLAA